MGRRKNLQSSEWPCLGQLASSGPLCLGGGLQEGELCVTLPSLPSPESLLLRLRVTHARRRKENL